MTTNLDKQLVAIVGTLALVAGIITGIQFLITEEAKYGIWMLSDLVIFLACLYRHDHLLKHGD